MHDSENRTPDSSEQPGVGRWDRWLRESLTPAVVDLIAFRGPNAGELRWTVAFPHGLHSEIRIPRALVEASAEDFHRTTMGLGSFPWHLALEQAGGDGLRLACPRPRQPRRTARTAATNPTKTVKTSERMAYQGATASSAG